MVGDSFLVARDHFLGNICAIIPLSRFSLVVSGVLLSLSALHWALRKPKESLWRRQVKQYHSVYSRTCIKRLP